LWSNCKDKYNRLKIACKPEIVEEVETIIGVEIEEGNGREIISSPLASKLKKVFFK
jgi:hypothetical protein